MQNKWNLRKCWKIFQDKKTRWNNILPTHLSKRKISLKPVAYWSGRCCWTGTQSFNKCKKNFIWGIYRNTSAIHLQYICYTSAIHLQCICNTSTTDLEYIYNTPAIDLEYIWNTPAINLQHTYNTSTIHLQYFCNTSAIHLQYIFNTLAIFSGENEQHYKRNVILKPMHISYDVQSNRLQLTGFNFHFIAYPQCSGLLHYLQCS